MTKIVLAMIILVSSICAGMIKAQQFSIRFRTLEQLHCSLRALESRMIYSLDSMPALIAHCVNDTQLPSHEFFAVVQKHLAEGGRSLAQCWSLALTETYSHGQLKKEDLDILNQLGSELGTTDLQGQRAAFLHAYQRLEMQMEESQEEKKNKEKLYRGIGIYVGLLIPLVLF